MAALTVQSVGKLGNADVTAASSATSDTVALTNGAGKRAGGYELQPMFVIITNADDSTHAVTIGSQDPVNVLAGDTAIFPVPSEGIGDTSLTIATDDATSQTVSVVRLTGA